MGVERGCTPIANSAIRCDAGTADPSQEISVDCPSSGFPQRCGEFGAMFSSQHYRRTWAFISHLLPPQRNIPRVLEGCWNELGAKQAP